MTILRIFKAADAFRKPERFEQFLLAVEADARGRKGFEDTPYVQGAWLRDLFVHLRQILPTEFVARGLKGAAIGEALDKKREQVIGDFKKGTLPGL